MFLSVESQLPLGLLRAVAFHAFFLKDRKDDLVKHGAVRNSNGLTVGSWESDYPREAKESENDAEAGIEFHDTISQENGISVFSSG